MALVVAPPALGQTSAQDGYSAPAGSVQQRLDSKRADSVSGDAVRSSTLRNGNSGGLPFTGLDIALVLVASGVLLAMGASIRRLSRPGA
jgi:hypothetical protein